MSDATAPETEQPFEDNPILAAKRRAFDNPNRENLGELIEVVRTEHSQYDHERGLIMHDRLKKMRALRGRVEALEAWVLEAYPVLRVLFTSEDAPLLAKARELGVSDDG